jgi:hypothetical protein
MRASACAFVICFLGIVLNIAFSARDDEMVVITTSTGANAAEGIWEWVVPKERASDLRNLWDPDSGKFPVDLNQYCQIALTNVLKRQAWSSMPELALVHIRQIYVQLNSNDPSSAPLRRTVVSFHFREAGTAPALGPAKPVMMLLDGTVATMRKPSGG